MPFDETDAQAEEATLSKLEAAFMSETGQEATPPEPVEPVEAGTDAPAEVEAPVAEGETQEPVVPAQEERPRGEDGKFLSREAAEQAEQERLYAGRYKTVEELEAAVVEKEAFISRQGTDVGSLRSELQEMRRSLEQRQAEQSAPAQPLPHNWDSMLDENPAQAVEIAYKADNQQAMSEALQAWNELAPGAPQLWVQNKQMEEQLLDLRESVGKQTSNSAYAEFSRTHPDVEQYAQEMGEIAKQAPYLTELLQNGDPRAQTEVLDFLYTKASTEKRARNADTLAKAQTEADAEKKATSRQQKENAAVASATQVAEKKPPRTAGHAFLEELRGTYHEPWDISGGITTD